MTTLAEWEGELRELRNGLGPTRPMLIKWFPVRNVLPRYPLVMSLRNDLRKEELRVQRWKVAIYPTTAEPGTRPTVMVDVPADSPLPISQPLIVEVAGRMDAGAAIAFRLPRGDIVFGLWPARPAPAMRRRRL